VSTAPLPAAGLIGYRQSSLADVLPSALAALGVPGEPNVLDLQRAECIVVLLVDGLGWQLLREHAEHAPFLSGLAGRSLTAGFPTTTAVSITSLGTGVAPGQHGITGYSTRADGLGEPVNWLTWRGARSGVDLTGEQPPEQVQPVTTAFERASLAGVNASVVSAPAFRASGLTRAALRGGQYLRAFTAADTATVVAETARTRGGLIYCYIADLDLIGHVHGCRSEAWRVQLELIDAGARLLADRLPAHARLLVTADHGMLDVPEHAKLDYDTEPLLREGIELLAGEARVRYLHVAPGELDAVRSRWTEVLGAGMAVLTRDEAIARGWFGPSVSDAARSRIGDLIAVSVSELSVVRRKAESRNASLVGHHGALTEAELLVPLLSS
jgi:predicted AlkP superfamily pyrophosphatase or phosphodiesterase